METYINKGKSDDDSRHIHLTHLAHINNYGIITSNMICPIFISHFFIRSAISISRLYIWFVLYTI
jgi:hypothetical protein